MVSLTAMASLWLIMPVACGGDEFDEQGSQCEEHYKMCGGRCVYYASASYGCTADTCEPCPAPADTLKHMVASCSEALQCNAVCETGFGLCGSDPSVGCDTNLQDNTHHCGWCKHDCAGALCDKGACVPVTIASGQTNPTSLTVNGGFVYWLNQSDAGAVMRAPIAGGKPEVVASGEKQPKGLAMNDTWLYFTTLSNGGEVRSALLSDMTVFAVAADPRGPAGIALQGGRLYWASENGGEVLSMLATSEEPETPKPIKAGLDKPSRVVASSKGWIVYTALGTGDVYCYRNGENLRISTGLNPTYLDTAGDEVYFVRAEGYVYHKSCEANLSDSPVYVPGSSHAIALAVDAAHLYFTTAQGVKRVLLDGGEAPVIESYSATTTAQEIAVDSQRVFWAEPSTGDIKAVAK